MQIEFTKEELSVLCNALNESMELLDPIDYTTRLSAKKEELEALMEKMNKILED